MDTVKVLELLASLSSIVLQSIYFITKLPTLFMTLISFIPDPFRTNLLMYFPIMFGLFIWKLVRG